MVRGQSRVATGGGLHEHAPDRMNGTVLIDGSYGEGGGQILRAALSLSMLTGRPFRVVNIRRKRPQPGLRPQHLTAVRAAAALCAAVVEGDAVGSTELYFAPQAPVQPGSYRFDVGTAGATTLILQTLLPPLAEAQAPSWVSLTGGTHVPWSPPFHYLSQAFVPALTRLGWRITLTIKRWGWYPRGRGRVQAMCQPPDPAPSSVDWTERGQLVHLWVLSASSNLPAHIRERQAKQARRRLQAAGLAPTEVEIVDAASPGIGTCVVVVGTYENGWGGAASLGQRGKPAERVADEAVDAFLAFHESGAALDPHLADQVIVPLVARRVSRWQFTTSQATNHLRTVIWLVQHFVPLHLTLEETPQGAVVRCSN